MTDNTYEGGRLRPGMTNVGAEKPQPILSAEERRQLEYIRKRWPDGAPDRATAADWAYAHSRYGFDAHEAMKETSALAVLAGQRSHIGWIASKMLALATDLMTEAQLREELAIENLVRAKNACDETVAPAEAVLAAAEEVENLEQGLETLAKIVEEHAGQRPDPDPTYPSDADGVVEDEPKAGDCDA